MQLQALIAVVILACVTARITRLVIKDTFPTLVWIREKLIGKLEERPDGTYLQVKKGIFPSDGAMAKLLDCPWCASFWVSFPVVIVSDQFITLEAPVLIFIAQWFIASYLLAIEPD